MNRAADIHDDVSGSRMCRKGIVSRSVVPIAHPVSIDMAFQTTSMIRSEGEAFVTSCKQVAADAFYSFLMLTFGVVTKTGGLLDGNGDVGTDHGLQIT